MPARNESRLVGNAIRSVLCAAQQAHVQPLIALVDDGSTDETASIARALIPPGFGCVYFVDAGNVGAARALGVEQLAADSPVRLDWVATTDADSTVPVNWFSGQLQHYREGADAVAGLVDIDNLLGELQSVFLEEYRRDVTSDGHPHVHGANLGFRIESCLAVGNFRHIPCGEDRDLWQRLGAAGFRLVTDSYSVVRTSARLVNRAEGGFAGDLRRLASGLRSA